MAGEPSDPIFHYRCDVLANREFNSSSAIFRAKDARESPTLTKGFLERLAFRFAFCTGVVRVLVAPLFWFILFTFRLVLRKLMVNIPT